MDASVASKRRAGGAFVLSALALIPLAVAAMLLGMVATKVWLWPAFVAAQLAFPRTIVRYTPFTRINVPLGLTILIWLALAYLFALLAVRMRIRRLWIAAPLAVLMCVLIANVAIHLAGFEVTLDGP
jgi:hypothetical protein